jgi:lipopolysaccharide export system protein LptA
LSKRADFDLKARVAIYKGDVRVKDPRMEMACEYLTVKLSQEAGKFDTILAESNVSVDFYDEKGQKVHCTGGRAIYTYEVKRGMTNDLLRLLDDPLLETAQGSWKGDIITLDRGNNTIRATNSRMVIKSEPGSTNRSLLGPMR